MASSNSSREALEVRLCRLEYAITGSTEAKDTSEKIDAVGGSIPVQISSLNNFLTRIGNRNKSVQRLLQVCIFTPTELV
jgi:hypothetical protein